ncbi:uncharacterized protein PAC_15360 [Phialocephala subalpina]|uniref:Uncharacterized protein n=1 Tax=Phialocephala subalpina TaxID=576137 RepID=A0A1L7XK76_9HELO|nr:uncharacterized protein PAC_15360 [Phialocephala subalpina]
MCGGKDNDEPIPPPHPIELPDRANPPSTSHRPQTSSQRQPRPPTSNSQRVSSSARPPKTSDGSRRKSSHGDHRARDQAGSSLRRPSKTSDGSRRKSSHGGDHRARHRIPEVEEHTEDKTIIRRLNVLSTFIEQHAENFFPRNGPSSEETEEFDDPHTRHANIRQYLVQTIISCTVTRNGNSSSDRLAIVREIFDYLASYSNANDEQRENHLLELCRLGSRLRDAIENHSSRWTFDFSSAEGYIVMVPALMRDGEEVVPSQMFRIN